MKVVWTDASIHELQALYDFIAQTSTFYASRIVDRLTRRSMQIESFPHSGRVVPEYEVDYIREIIEYPYRIIYRIREEYIEVLSVIHSARLLPEDL